VRRRLLLISVTAVAGGGLACVAAAGSTTPSRAGRPAPTRQARSAKPVLKSSNPAAAVTAFGIDLMARIGGTGNIVFSPYSVASVVAMAGAGASGRTATQIARVLDLRSPTQIAGIGRLSGTLAREQSAASAGAADPPQLDLANGLFVERSFPLLPAFTATLTTGFGAPPQPVDFETDAAGATQAINQFVSSHTAGVIPPILGPGQLDASTRLALVNAIYLKAAWKDPFPAAATATRTFVAPGGRRPVPFMTETDSLAYAKGSGYQAVELPYANSTFALLVLKPAHTEAALQKRVTPGLIARAQAGLRPATVALSMPRFHISLQANLDSELEQLGMTAAFSPGSADFSGISPTPLYVSFVQHDADFTVDEQGTIATAATVGGISATALELPPRPTARSTSTGRSRST
jgi:serpin B